MDKDINLTFHTGVGTVTGANFLLESKNTKLLVDCGLLQGFPEAEEENKKPFPYNPKEINYLFLTHAHLDHIGRVCKLVKDGFSGIIYSTPETKEIAQVLLPDAIKVMKTKALEEGKEGDVLYDTQDFEKSISLWKTIPYHSNIKINDELSVYLKDAGHILGSAMYEFDFLGKKIVFTGDTGNTPTPLLKNTEIVDNADYLIVDSVYGDRNHEPKEVRDGRFKKIVLETIKNNGALVIPAFSIERTQVVLYELNNLVEEKQIPRIPVFLDSPLGLKVTDIYSREFRNFNGGVQGEISGGDDIFNFPNLSITHSSGDSREIVNTPNPKIIIAGSGMSTGGRVLWHEINFLPDPKSTILLMGYQALGTLGREIQNKPKEVFIKGKKIPVKAKIETISGFSSHKDSDNLVDFVSYSSDKVKKVFVVMGEPKASLYLVQRLRDELDVDAIYPERGVSYKLK